MTASTAPEQPVTISSVVCQSCDTRWPETPRFPETWICPACRKWIEEFNEAATRSGLRAKPVAGPVKTVRRLLCGRNVTTTEYTRDTSAWILVHVHPDIHTRIGPLTETTPPLNDTDPDDHIPAQKIRG